MLYFILTNKANFQIDEKFIIPYEGSTYENKSAKSAVKNKAKQSQFYGEPVEPSKPILALATFTNLWNFILLQL